MEHIINAIGNTPFARIHYRFAGEEACVYVKLESYNLTGSIKDRMVMYVLSEAYKRGELVKAQPIIEVTSGNTGISLSAIGSSMGHPVHIFMPDWVSRERRALMEMYGASLHLVSEAQGGFLGAIKQAEALSKTLGGYLPDQFNNPDNIKAHELGTGAEVLASLPEVDGFVAGVGSGGTLMGVGRRLNADHPVITAAVEPDAMPVLSGGAVRGPHAIEGIGDEFIPGIVEPSAIDRIITINDKDAVNMARLLAQKLGLGVGISSGANFLGAVRLTNEAKLSHVATTFADDNKKYVSTSLRDKVDQNAQYLSNQIQLLDYTTVDAADGAPVLKQPDYTVHRLQHGSYPAGFTPMLKQ